ncbi:MAG TPA: translocation/assembly module TamB domain-containing protein [Polyangiaceae bacterium]|nr:translocation/assembly module TamB domain-containing protein [Polyangiaceae bacterium]
MSGRWRRHGERAHRAGGAALLVPLFVALLVASLLAHGDTPAARRFVARAATELLSSIFEGRLELDAIEHVGFDGVDVGRVRVYDPAGRLVIEGRGLHARSFVPDLLRRVFAGGPLVISIPTIRLEEAEVVLRPERRPEGGATVSIERAFRPREGPPEPEPEVGTLPRVVVVDMPAIELGHGAVRGEPAEGLPIEADVFEARASLRAGNRGVVLDVGRSGLGSRFLPPLSPRGTAEYHLRVPEPDDARPVLMWASFNGEIGRVPSALTARLEGGVLDARLDVARARADEVRSLLPGLPLLAEVSARLEAKGELPDLAFEGEVGVGPGRIKARGEAALGSPLSIGAQIEARGLDARSFFEGAPAFALGADLTARFRLEDLVPSLVLQGATLPTEFEGQKVPPVAARARLEGDAWRVDGRVEEPGLPVAIDLRVAPGGEVTFEAQGRAADLRAVPRLGGALAGSATLRAQGRASPRGLDVALDGRLAGFAAPGVSIGRASLTGRLHGPYSAPLASLSVAGEGASVAALPVARVEARATGTLRSSRVAVRLVDPRWDQLDLAAEMGLAPAVAFRDVRAGFRRGELKAEGAVAAIERLPGGGFALRRVRLESTAGSASADLVLRPADVDLEARGSVHLARLAPLLPGLPMTGGEAALLVSVHGDARGRRSGRASVRVSEAELAKLPLRAGAELHASFEGDRVALAYAAGLRPVGGQDVVTLEGRGEGTLRGSLLEPSTYERAVGRLEVHRATLHFDRAHRDPTARALLSGVPALSSFVRGTAHATLSVERDRPDGWPALRFSSETKQLAVALPAEKGARDPETGQVDARRRLLQGLDLLATLDVHHEGEGARARTTVAAGLRAADRQGALAFAEAHTEAPTERLVADLGALLSGPPGRALPATGRLRELPLGGKVALVARPFADWPRAVRPKGLEGRAGASVELSGTLGDPNLDVLLRLERVATTPERGAPWSIDGQIAGRFERERSEVWGRLSHEGEDVVELAGRADVGVGMLARGDDPNWSAGGLVVVRGLELGALPGLAEAGVSGRLSGTVALDDLHAKPDLRFDFTLLRGKVLGGEFPSGTLRGRLTAEGGSFVTATLRQGASHLSPGGGLFEATALASVDFEDGLWPALDPDEPQTFGVRLRQLDVAPFAALAEPVFADLGGLLSGEATLSLRARPGEVEEGSPAAGAATTLEGHLFWRQGVLLVPQVGQTFRQGRFDLRATTEGETVRLRLADLAVGATSGTIEGSGEFEVPTASLRAGVLGKGTPEGLDWASGRASLRIRESQKIPLTFEGVPVGNAFGVVDAWVRARPEGAHVAVALPDVTLELPEGATRDVQELGDPADIGVVDRRNRRTKLLREEDAYPFTIELGLGESLASLAGKAGTATARGVFVERSGTDVAVRGRPVVEITDAVRMRGSVEAVYGRVTILGKPFVIDRFSARWGNDDAAEPGALGGEASNPFVSVRARWDSSDGTRIYAETDDYLEDIKLRLRSDPPRSDAGVRALLLYGRDPTASASNLSPGFGLGRRRNAANDAAIGGVSTVLNSLLDVEIFGRRIETRVGTGHAGDSRFGAAMEVRENLWLTVDTSTLSNQQADRMSSTDRAAATLDWRFRPRWSLRTTIGYGSRYGALNAGPSTALDLIWQYRY